MPPADPTLPQRLAKLQQELAWLQLTGWHAPPHQQRQILTRIAHLKRQIELIRRNTHHKG